MSVPASPVVTLQRALATARPRQSAAMATALAYGRHRGPARSGSRVAAVAIAIYLDDDGQWKIPLTLRPSTLKHHGGQVCLPGGRVEPGESIREAALREFEEELGRVAKVTTHCGELSTQYVYASDNLVHPVVMMVDRPSLPWRPDPVEVAEVIAMPLSVLSDSSGRVMLTKSRPMRRDGVEVGRFTFRAAAIRYREHDIWGATALILDELARILHHSKFDG